MNIVKTSVTLPDDIFKEAKSMSDNFSFFVTEALRSYIHKKKVERAMNSFGKWKERKETGVEIVDEVRTDEGRDYANRND